jgi:hypothetical protein
MFLHQVLLETRAQKGFNGMAIGVEAMGQKSSPITFLTASVC